MKAVTAEEMQEIDRISINDFGIPGEVLMFNAGKKVFDFIIDNIAGIKNVAVFSGTGNNGGDGFVIAYLLSNYGINASVFLSGDIERITPVSYIYYSLCIKAEVDIIRIKDDLFFESSTKLNGFDLIVDSLIGTGFRGPVKGIAGSIIKLINSSEAKVLSVDIPSGLSSNGEAPAGDVVKADYTVTFGLPKISLVTYPGKTFSGHVEIADIGFPKGLTGSDNLRVNLIDREYVSGIIKHKQDPDMHKSQAGHLLLIGGFEGMEGSIIMAARGALECGVGMISLATTEKARGIIAGNIPEMITDAIVNAYPEDTESLMESKINSGIDRLFKKYNYDALLIGPGMGRSVLSQKIFNMVLNRVPGSSIKNILIDGDGLYHLAENFKKGKRELNGSIIVTPHFKEAARLLGTGVPEIKSNRLLSAIEISKKLSAITILKGPSSIITDGTFSYINTTGNPALATAGSGDVLSGVIGSFMLRYSPIQSACAGAYIHGLAADLFCEENRTDSMKATDIINYLKKTISNN